MTKKIFGTILSVLIITSVLVTGCTSNKPVTEMQTVAVAQNGDLEIKVEVSGYIEMPTAVNLYFDSTMFTPPYSARIEKIYVNKGDLVKAGALLAKLDDATQTMAVESAQYSLELAINNVVQTVCCGVVRTPSFYSDAVALYRFQFATAEIQNAQSLLKTGDFASAASQIALAKFDIDASKNVYTDPEYASLRTELGEYTKEVVSSFDAETAIARLNSESDSISIIQSKITAGNYNEAGKMLDSLLTDMAETNVVVQRTTHSPAAYTCPDSCTGFTIINEALAKLEEAKQMASSDNADPLKLNETLQMVIHDLEIGDKVLKENVSTYRQGLNLKTQRDYSISIQTGLINLDRAKQSLLKTELLAPFDGEIVDVNLHAGDMITQRYSVTGLPIDVYVLKLADTSTVTMIGVLDEIDAAKISRGQKATVTVDALPGKTFDGQVQFVSPYGTLQTGTGSYQVEISLSPEAAPYLVGGMTATAEIITDKRTDVLLIPNDALHSQDGENWVYVVNQNKVGELEKRQVQVGLKSRTQSEIISGLNQGERVLLETGNMPARAINNDN